MLPLDRAKAIKEYVESTVPIEDEQTCWHSGYIQTIAAVAPVRIH
jgi:hypothetical protein